jgi:hypothetical protein
VRRHEERAGKKGPNPGFFRHEPCLLLSEIGIPILSPFFEHGQAEQAPGDAVRRGLEFDSDFGFSPGEFRWNPGLDMEEIAREIDEELGVREKE